MVNIDWILEEKIIVTKYGHSGIYHVESFNNPIRVVDISMSKNGRMLFDGKDIETESFMGFVGLMDSMDGEPTDKPVVLEAE